VTLVNFGLFAFEKLRTDKLSKLLFTNSPSKPEKIAPHVWYMRCERNFPDLSSQHQSATPAR